MIRQKNKSVRLTNLRQVPPSWCCRSQSARIHRYERKLLRDQGYAVPRKRRNSDVVGYDCLLVQDAEREAEKLLLLGEGVLRHIMADPDLGLSS